MSERILRANTPLNEQKQNISEKVKLQVGNNITTKLMTTEIQTETISKIAIYLRCSSDEQNVDSQMLFVEGLVRSYGFKVEECRIFKDEGMSATKMKDLQNRPQGLALMEAIKNDELTHVFAYRVDRLFRDLEGGAKFITEMKTNYPNVSIITTDCPLPLTHPDGEFFFGMQVLFARREAAVLSQRTQGGMQSTQENLKVSSNAIYGWNICHKQNGEKTMRPNWKEQSVLDWIVEQNKKGWSNPKIAKQLCAWGIPTKKGSQWVGVGVRRHLVSPAKMHEQLHQFSPPKNRLKAPFRSLSTTQK